MAFAGERSKAVLRHRKLRRTVGAMLVIAGGALMWLAPAAAFVPYSAVGIALLAAGVVLEVVGITLEHRDRNVEGRGEP
jgi:uncharacterized membrane protein HdeD (DUF308 family)